MLKFPGIDRLTEIFEYTKEYIDSKISGSGTSSSEDQSSTTVFNSDGSITETFDDYVSTTTFETSGNIVETKVYSDKTVTITTTFNSDGSISKSVTNT